MTVENRYRLVEKIGQGGMAEVYLAEHLKTGARVVLKSPLPGLLIDNPELMDRFLDEIRKMSRLDHTNIVKVHDVLEWCGRPVAVMQYFGGGSLDTKPGIKLDRWLPQITSALDYMHSPVRSMVHRDVKPANIFFDLQDTPYLGDFGIAKSHKGDTVYVRTVTGNTLGTPKYMSPEAVHGRTLDGRADQYSLAIVVYEQLSGRIPFDDVDQDSAYHVMKAHAEIEPLPLCSIDARYNRATSVVLEQALSKSPAARYASCSEFAQALVASFEAVSNDEGTADEKSPVDNNVSPANVRSLNATTCADEHLSEQNVAGPEDRTAGEPDAQQSRSSSPHNPSESCSRDMPGDLTELRFSTGPNWFMLLCLMFILFAVTSLLMCAVDERFAPFTLLCFVVATVSGMIVTPYEEMCERPVSRLHRAVTGCAFLPYAFLLVGEYTANVHACLFGYDAFPFGRPHVDSPSPILAVIPYLVGAGVLAVSACFMSWVGERWRKNVVRLLTALSGVLIVCGIVVGAGFGIEPAIGGAILGTVVAVVLGVRWLLIVVLRKMLQAG